MSIDPNVSTYDAPKGAGQAPSMWRRFLNWMKAFEEAMDTSYDDFQDRRILALEREVVQLKSRSDEARLTGSVAELASDATAG